MYETFISLSHTYTHACTCAHTHTYVFSKFMLYILKEFYLPGHLKNQFFDFVFLFIYWKFSFGFRNIESVRKML